MNAASPESRQPPGRLAIYLPPLTALLVLLALTGYSVTVVLLNPGPLQPIDDLIAAGHYHNALTAYQELIYDPYQPIDLIDLQDPALQLRLGILHTVRGEWSQAERNLWPAVVSSSLDAAQRETAIIYLGYVLANREQPEQALKAWQRSSPCEQPPEQCPLAGLRELITAEWQLTWGNHAAAARDYQVALDHALPLDWYRLARYRLALLQAPDDSQQAATLLTQPLPTDLPAAEPLLQPLLPVVSDEVSGVLIAILQAEPERIPPLLGQFYLDQGYHDLALAQFRQIPDNHPFSLNVDTHTAYLTWLTGDLDATAARFRQLATDYSVRESLPAMVALAHITSEMHHSSTTPISQTLESLAITQPETHLAWAAWYTLQGDYEEVRRAYQLALALADPDDRGTYALLIAQFHLRSTYTMCTDGLETAQIATAELPASADAWTVRAGLHYQCRQFAAAIDTAERALRLEQRADASFYHGAALAYQGDFVGARSLLIQAADLAPASIWRQRAELLLAEF